MSASDLSDDDRELLEAATRARANSFAPISRYRVGAALRAPDGAIIAGCNVEHIILGMTSCAEVVAVQTGVAAGHRHFKTAAVMTSSSPPATPCGNCRQILLNWEVEKVICGNTQGEVAVYTLDELLPHGFQLKAPLPEDAED